MYYALIDNEISPPEPKARGICPLCGEKVHARCGEINVNHWAHFRSENCDDWSEPESNWHISWKEEFAPMCREVTREKEGKKRRADVCTSKGVVIELQNSSISAKEITDREEFYGEEMLWIVNGCPEVKGEPTEGKFRITEIQMNPFALEQEWGVEFSSATKRSLMSVPYFSWKRHRKAWSFSNRPVFIDLGGDKLFWFRDSIDNYGGKGTIISKQELVNHYRD